MFIGRCYCSDIRDYRDDLGKLETVKTNIHGIAASLAEIQGGLDQLKAATVNGCNADMQSFAPFNFLSPLSEVCASGRQATESKGQSVRSSINTLSIKDKSFHKLLAEEIEVGS